MGLPRRSERALRYLAEDAFTGYGEASYRLVEALRAAGIAVEYRAWHAADRDGPARVGPFRRDERPECSVAEDAPTIAHLVPEHYPAVRTVVAGGPLVAHTVWETDRLPARWADLLNALDAVLVPCEWNREVFAAGGVTTPIDVVPHVVCDPVPGDRGALGLPDDDVVFYTIARWDARKAPWLALRAYLEAFTAADPVALVVKTTQESLAPPLGEWGSGTGLAGTTALEVARLIREYRRPARVRLDVAPDVPTERIAGLHTRGDCYVSLARGEGWGLGAFDACAYGNPVVTTGWGGQLDYLGLDQEWLVDYEIVPVSHRVQSSYSPDQNWAEPSIEHGVELLRKVAADLDGARRRAAPLRERVRRDYAPPVVAGKLLAALDAV